MLDGFKPKFAELMPTGRKLFKKHQERYSGPVNNKSAVAAFAALGFETRLQAVQLLVAAGDDGLPAGEIARRLGVPQNTLSDHLKALTQAGVVTPERQSRSIIYRANRLMIRDLATFLNTKCLAA